VTAKRNGAKTTWETRLLRTLPKGEVKFRPVVANVVTVLTSDDRWAGVLAYDEFAEGIVKLKAAPWRDLDTGADNALGDWSDDDTTRMQCWLSDAYALDVSEGAVLGAVKLAARRKIVHPVRDWLNSLRWDGTKRLPTWLIDVMGCEDSSYVRSVGQAWGVSAAARAYKPGCKVDTVLVLEGKPGIFKSSVLRALVADEWFLEMSISDVANKDAMQLLRRKWVAEFPEIDGLSRTEQAHVKSYFSRQVDTYRPSYGKGTRDFPRQVVFAATTNKNEYLTDETGGSGRRMWPVRCTRGYAALASDIREQFWAEARVRYECGEPWHIIDPDLRDDERSEQDARFRADPWEQPIAEWLAKPGDVHSKAVLGVSTSDALQSVGLDIAKRDNGHAARVGSVLRRLGWVPGKHPESRNGVRVRLYRPAEGAATNGHTLVPLEHGPDAFLEPEAHTEDAFPAVSVFEEESGEQP
jgi:putative DNA primase/helicase